MQSQSDNDVTRILSELRAGDSDAANQLLPLVYDELRGIAGRIFQARGVLEKTVQPTILVHDVFLKLAHSTEIEWESRAHFFAIASKAIRDLLIDHARSRLTAKRGGNWNRVALTGISDPNLPEKLIDVVDLDNALKQLGELFPRQEQIVEMRFYAGMTVDEVAEVMGVTSRTIMYDWRMARAWLRSHLQVNTGG